MRGTRRRLALAMFEGRGWPRRCSAGRSCRTRKSRSQLYAEALAEYLVRHAPDEVTEAMNGVVDELGDTASDSFVQRAGPRMLRSVEW